MSADTHFLLHWKVRRGDFHDDFLISAGRDGVGGWPKLQIPKKCLRKAALSPRKNLTKSDHSGPIQHLGLNNCYDNILMQIILNIHFPLHRGIIVVEKLLEVFFSVFSGFSSFVMTFNSYFCVWREMKPQKKTAGVQLSSIYFSKAVVCF